MWKKIAITAACGAAVVGAGTAAMATSPVSTNLDTVASSAAPSTTPSTGTTGTGTKAKTKTGAKHDKGDLLKRIGNVAHASWVSKDKAGTYVTHDAIHGTVTAVSATSITLKAGDGTSETYVVASATKVRIRSNGKGAAGTIGAVKAGEKAVVSGTGTSTLTADLVVAGLAK